MESAVAIGLLPLIKAFYNSENHNDLSFIDLTTIVNSIPLNSVVIEKLIQELSLYIPAENIKLPDYKDYSPYPSTYSIGAFFTKYVNTFLAPIYRNRADEIESKTYKPFLKQWAFTADEIAEEAGVRFNANQANYYGRSEHDSFLTGFSTKISEVCRSAFLRILQSFYMNGDITYDFYLEYAYATLPIDLSKWEILPNQIPDWWPQQIQIDKNDQSREHIRPVTFKNPIEDLIRDDKQNILLAAEGSICPSNESKLSDPEHSFSLIGFAYKILGSQIPSSEDLAENILYSPSLVIIPSRSDRPFHFLENQKEYLTTKNDYIRIKDMIVYPLIARERDLCIALWQYFRDFEVPINLNLPLSQNLKLSINHNGWAYQNENGENIVAYADWLNGLKERYEREMPIPHGQFITIDKQYLYQWMEEKGVRIGYILKIVYRAKKDSYGEVRKFEDIKLLNVSPIITP